jgi:hypothetical protein
MEGGCLYSFFSPFLTEVSSRPERSVVEGPAVHLRTIESEWKRHPPLCHPDRSVAKWRDLQFRGPLLEMFFDRV